MSVVMRGGWLMLCGCEGRRWLEGRGRVVRGRGYEP